MVPFLIVLQCLVGKPGEISGWAWERLSDLELQYIQAGYNHMAHDHEYVSVWPQTRRCGVSYCVLVGHRGLGRQEGPQSAVKKTEKRVAAKPINSHLLNRNET